MWFLSECDRGFTNYIKYYYFSFVISFIFAILRHTTTFYERHSVFCVMADKWRHFWNLEFWRSF